MKNVEVLYPIILNNMEISKSIKNFNKEHYITIFSRNMKDFVINDSSSSLKEFALHSKSIYKEKMKLNISTYEENLIIIDFINNVIGNALSNFQYKNKVNNKFEEEYNRLSNSMKNIINYLYIINKEISHKELAKALNVTSAAISKTLNQKNSYDFIYIYKVNQRCVYYSLKQDFKDFIKKSGLIKSSKETSHLNYIDILTTNFDDTLFQNDDVSQEKEEMEGELYHEFKFE